MNSPRFLAQVDQITVSPGETITIYLRESYDRPDSVQVELRVLLDGRREVFCTDSSILKSFDDWTDADKRGK